MSINQVDVEGTEGQRRELKARVAHDENDGEVATHPSSSHLRRSNNLSAAILWSGDGNECVTWREWLGE